MNKREFLDRLREALAGLPRDDIEERLSFYSEMIEDRMEDGLSEVAAVAEIGPAEEIVTQIVAETPLPRLVRERMRPKRRLQAWEIVLIVLGSPVWLPLLTAAFVLLLAVYIVLWSLIVSLWAVEASFIAAGVSGAAAGVWMLFRGSGAQALLLFGAGSLLAGLSIFFFYGCRAGTGGASRLSKKIALGVKSLFLRRETAV